MATSNLKSVSGKQFGNADCCVRSAAAHAIS